MDHQQNDRHGGYQQNPNHYQPYTGPSSSNATPPRSITPNTEGNRNPFGDAPDGAYQQRQATATGTNPFVSPAVSRPPSSFGSSSALGPRFEERAQRYFHSRRVGKGEVEKPWLQKKDKKEKWVTIIPIIGIIIGLAISGFLVWDGLRSVVHHKYCPLLDDNFDNGFDTNVWEKEVQVGGFGYVLLLSRNS